MGLADVAAERTRTPGVSLDRPGGIRRIHLNAAGAALPTREVLAAVIDHLHLESRVGGYEAAALVADRAGMVYRHAARLLGAGPEDIALVESATVGWHRAIDALRLRRGQRVLATRSTYVSSALNLLELHQREGVQIELLPNTPDGQVDLDALRVALRSPAALVTAAHVPTSSGLIEPVVGIGEMARAAGVPYLLDATQSMGQLELDVGAIDAGMVISTGRKFLRAPRGTGLLYISPEMRSRLRPTTVDVRGATWSRSSGYQLSEGALRFETWEAAHALRLGLGVALEQLLAVGQAEIARYISSLGTLLRNQLADIPGIQVLDPAAAGGGIVTFQRVGQAPAVTQKALAIAGFSTVTVPATHGQWDLGDRKIDAVVRASFHTYNDVDDVDAIVAFLREDDPAPRRRSRGTPAVPPRPETSPAEIPAGRRGNPGGRGSTAGESTDVVVVGAGITGRSAAWQLAGRGLGVVLLEQFGVDHGEGSSHGRSRMIRRAYPSEIWDGYVDSAYAAWSDLAQESGVELIEQVGGLFARPIDTGPGLSGPGCRRLDAAGAARVFPGLHLGPEFGAVHDPTAGIIDAVAAMSALTRLGSRAGVDARYGTPALSYRHTAGGVTVSTPEGEISADRLVVCAGPWTAKLLPHFAPSLDVVRIVNIHVGSSMPAKLAPPALGVFSVDVPGVGLLYGIPAHRGAGVKVGLDQGVPDDPELRTQPVTDAEIATLHALVRRFLPAADGRVEETIACRYTMAPRNRFAIGPLPHDDRVLVAAACSGHGFKFGPATGAALADMVLGIERPDLDWLSPGRLLPDAPVRD